MKQRVIGCLVGVLGAAGCAAEPADEPGQAIAAQAIQGGATDSGDPSVGYLRIYRSDSGGSFYDSCTATMISPVVLLTAAHCLPRPGTSDAFDGFYTGSGSATSPGSLPSNLTWHGVSNYVAYPGDSYHSGGYNYGSDPYSCPASHIDLGVVRLSSAITGVGTYNWQHNPTVFQGAQCTTVGYGLHGTSQGLKYSAQDTVDSTPNGSWYAASSSTGLVVRWTSSDNGIADHGDSGGPLICSNQWGTVIAGVVSCHNEEVDPRSQGGTETYAPIFESMGEGPSVWIEYYWCTWTGYLCYV